MVPERKKADEASPTITERSLCAQMGLQAEQGRITELRRQRPEFTEAGTAGPDGPEYQMEDHYTEGELQKSTWGPWCPWLSTRLGMQSVRPQEAKQRTTSLGIQVPTKQNEETSLNTQNTQKKAQKGHT